MAIYGFRNRADAEMWRNHASLNIPPAPANHPMMPAPAPIQFPGTGCHLAVLTQDLAAATIEEDQTDPLRPDSPDFVIRTKLAAATADIYYSDPVNNLDGFVRPAIPLQKSTQNPIDPAYEITKDSSPESDTVHNYRTDASWSTGDLVLIQRAQDGRLYVVEETPDLDIIYCRPYHDGSTHYSSWLRGECVYPYETELFNSTSRKFEAYDGKDVYDVGYNAGAGPAPFSYVGRCGIAMEDSVDGQYTRVAMSGNVVARLEDGTQTRRFFYCYPNRQNVAYPGDGKYCYRLRGMDTNATMLVGPPDALVQTVEEPWLFNSLPRAERLAVIGNGLTYVRLTDPVRSPTSNIFRSTETIPYPGTGILQVTDLFNSQGSALFDIVGGLLVAKIPLTVSVTVNSFVSLVMGNSQYGSWKLEIDTDGIPLLSLPSAYSIPATRATTDEHRMPECQWIGSVNQGDSIWMQLETTGILTNIIHTATILTINVEGNPIQT